MLGRPHCPQVRPSSTGSAAVLLPSWTPGDNDSSLSRRRMADLSETAMATLAASVLSLLFAPATTLHAILLQVEASTRRIKARWKAHSQVLVRQSPSLHSSPGRHVDPWRNESGNRGSMSDFGRVSISCFVALAVFSTKLCRICLDIYCCRELWCRYIHEE
jgi:hypothetical protein